MNVNIGCGHYPLEGYINVDKYAAEADVRADALECDFTDVEDVVAFHVLEHLTKQQADDLLRRILGWMAPRGTLTVETPDMGKILELGEADGSWASHIYGSQEHEGEFHRWGYTEDMLWEAVGLAGWTPIASRTFYSRESQRQNMPCVLVVAHA